MKKSCWLIGHRPAEAMQYEGGQGVKKYAQRCLHCSKIQKFEVTSTGRHNLTGWV